MPNIENGAKLWRVPRPIDGHLILDEKDVVGVYEVTSKLNPITADTQDMNQARRRFQAALDSLEPGEKVQIIVECSRYNPREDLDRMKEKVSADAPADFRVFYPNLLEHYVNAYCTLNMVPEFHYYVLFMWKQPKVLGSDTGPSLKTALNEVKRRGEDFAKLLAGNHLECRSMTREAITDLIDKAANPTRLTAVPAADLAAAQGASGAEADAAELLFRSPVVNTVPQSDRLYSFIQVGGRLVKTVGFTRAPQTDDSLGDALADLMMRQREFRLSYYVEGVSQTKAVDLVQRRRRAAMGAVAFSEGKETQQAEEQAHEFDGLIRAHARKELKFVRWSAYLSVFAEEEAELHQASTELASAFVGLVPEEGLYRQVEYWQSALPLGTDKATKSLLAQSNAVAQLFPFYEMRSSSPEGGLLLGFSPANQPCYFDPFSKIVSNGNVFVTGQAGSGKSYLINNILNRLGPMALDVSIIDKAKSYRSTILAMGGSYIEFDLNGKQSVNVWDLMEFNPEFEELGLNDVTRTGQVQPAKIEDVSALAEIILAEPGHPLPTLDMSVLQEDIKDTYRRVLAKNKGKITPETVPLFADLAETFKLKLDDPDKDPNKDFSEVRKLLLQKLSPAIDGTLAALVNRRTTLRAEGRARVFDISNLPDQPMILGVTNYILASWLYRHWKRNKALGIRQIGVVDEMAMFMRTRAGRDLLFNLARRSRHIGLMPFFATQELEDVLQYEETKSILNNCKTMFLFSQAKNVIDRVTDTLSLTDQERAHLENLVQVRGVYSSAFFIYGSMRNILTIRPDPATRWLNTTEPTYDVPRVNAALQKTGGDVWEAVKQLIASERK